MPIRIDFDALIAGCAAGLYARNVWAGLAVAFFLFSIRNGLRDAND